VKKLYIRGLSMKNNNLKDLNLRAFPEDLHRKAKAKAAMMGISLKELIIRAITEYIKRAN
jgi:predicted HicB family RNase H-like nuclease